MESVVVLRFAQLAGGLLHLLANHVGVIDVAQFGSFLLCFRSGKPGFGRNKNAGVGGLRYKWLQVRLAIEDAGNFAGQCIFKVQWPQAQEFVDSAGDGAHTGVLMRNRTRLDPGAGDQQDTSVRVDVVHAVLGVVFGDKKHRIFPNRCLRQECDQTAQRQVVVGHVRSAVGITVGRAGIGGVVIWQANDNERRDFAGREFQLEIALEFRTRNWSGMPRLKVG